MPPARSASARSASARSKSARGRRAPEPAFFAVRRTAERVRWDRVGRVGLLVTLGIVVCLYIQPALSIFTTWRAERQQASVVHQLLRSNRALERQVRSLNQTATIVAEARALGMVRSGERPYVVLGVAR